MEWNRLLLDGISNQVYSSIIKVLERDENICKQIPTMEIPNIFEKHAAIMTQILSEEFHFEDNQHCFFRPTIPAEVINYLSDLDWKTFPIFEDRWNRLQKQKINVHFVSPKFLRDQARLSNISLDDVALVCKLLQFCVSHEDVSSDWTDIEGIPFIPLLKHKNHPFGILQKDQLFRVTSNELQQITAPLLDYLQIVDEQTIKKYSSDNVNDYVCKGLNEISSQTIAKAVQEYLHDNEPSVEWLSCLFSYMNQSEQIRNHFVGLKLLLTNSNNCYLEIQSSLSNEIINIDQNLDLIRNDLETLQIHFLHENLRKTCEKFVQPPTPIGILHVLFSNSNQIKTLNHIFSIEFFQFMSSFSDNNDQMIHNLRCLTMFPTLDGMISIQESNEFHYIEPNIENEFLFLNSKSTTIIYQNEKEKCFLQLLGVTKQTKYQHLKDFLSNSTLDHSKTDQATKILLTEYWKDLIGEEDWQNQFSIFRCKDGSLKSFSELYNETDELKLLLTNEKFLMDSLDSILQSCRPIQKLQETLTDQDIIQIAQRISDEKDEKLSLHLIEYIIDHHVNLSSPSSVTKITWVYVGKMQFISPSKLIPKESAFEAASQFTIFPSDILPKTASHYVCQAKITPKKRFLHYIYLQNNSLPCTENLTSLLLDQWDQIPQKYKEQEKIKSIWIPMKQDDGEFIEIQALGEKPFASLLENLELYQKYFPILPSSYLKCSKALQEIGIPNEFSTKIIEKVIQQVADDKGNQELSDEEIKFYLQLLECFIQRSLNDDNKTNDFKIPNQSCELIPLGEILFNDMPWCKPKEGENLTHTSISYDLAQKLTIRERREETLASHAIFEQFQQTTLSLVETLNQIIKSQYILGDTLLIELIQNADDAKAKQIEFILCEKGFPDKSLIDSSLSSCQKASALYSFNNEKFSEEDFKSIQRLEKSCKRNDSMKTGTFGLGWNVVYHITDKPSFISGKYWVILDPVN